MTFIHSPTLKRPTDKSPLNKYLTICNYLRYVQVLKDIFPAHSLLTEELNTLNLILTFFVNACYNSI